MLISNSGILQKDICRAVGATHIPADRGNNVFGGDVALADLGKVGAPEHNDGTVGKEETGGARGL